MLEIKDYCLNHLLGSFDLTLFRIKHLRVSNYLDAHFLFVSCTRSGLNKNNSNPENSISHFLFFYFLILLLIINMQVTTWQETVFQCSQMGPFLWKRSFLRWSSKKVLCIHSSPFIFTKYTNYFVHILEPLSLYTNKLSTNSQTLKSHAPSLVHPN